MLDEGPPRVGQRWIDVTVPGLRPAMATSALERPHTWSETGEWRGLDVVATLTFSPTATGCRVALTARMRGRGPWRPLGPVLSLLAELAVGPDLRRAARVLAARPPR